MTIHDLAIWLALAVAFASVCLLLTISIRGIRSGAALLGLSLLLLTSDAEACQRCGIFGRGCRFVSYYQPVAAYAAPATTQNFVFNNTFPTPLLAQGNSVYGYSLAAQAYSVDPAAVLDRAGRLAELAFSSGQKAVDDFNDTAGTALALSADASRRSQNTLLALSAIQANQSEQPAQSLSFRATVTNGKLSLERIEAHPAAPASRAPCEDCPPPPPDGSLSFRSMLPAPVSLSATCGKCHDGTGKGDTPRGLVIGDDTPVPADSYPSWAARVMAGEMPPKSNLPTDARLMIIGELASQRGKPAQRLD